MHIWEFNGAKILTTDDIGKLSYGQILEFEENGAGLNEWPLQRGDPMALSRLWWHIAGMIWVELSPY